MDMYGWLSCRETQVHQISKSREAEVFGFGCAEKCFFMDFMNSTVEYGHRCFEDIHQLLSRAEYSSFSLITFHLSHLNKVFFIQRICSFLGFPTIALAGIVSSGLLPFSPRVLLLWSKVSFDVSIANAFVPNAN